MISRDGACVSLWQESVAPYETRSHKIANRVFDVAIVGGGITGITLALLLQKAGKKCVVLEANNIGFGTTGGTTAHLNTLLDTPYSQIIKDFNMDAAQLVAEAVNDAIDLVESHVEEYGIQCGFERTSAYLFSQDNNQTDELRDILDACNDVGVKSSYINYIPLPIPFQQAIEVPRQAKFNPLRYVYSLAHAFEEEGGVILQHCRVKDADEEDDLIRVETSQEAVRANQLVYATHIPPGINLLHLRCPAYRSYAMAVKLSDDKYPNGLCYDMYDPYHYYRTQDVDGVKYLIVGGEDHRTGENSNTNKCFLQLESHIRSHFNVSEVAFKWSSQYYEPVDGLPYIGKLPGATSDIFVATGFGGNGMTYSHVAALELKELLIEKESRYNNLFNPLRVKPVAGFTEFIKHNTDVVAQFVGKWFATERLEELSALAAGEGRVIKLEKETVALYKDEHGSLHAVNPLCTHMKCSVAWNAAEKSWDCPCHGARYSMDGVVLNGPTDIDLELIELRSLMEKED
jgi:glycine/D-amino acid oxidase-like deaminating enzyme/nitrite reductase/ring-hydroxylating ferredoxin subunit